MKLQPCFVEYDETGLNHFGLLTFELWYYTENLRPENYIIKLKL